MARPRIDKALVISRIQTLTPVKVSIPSAHSYHRSYRDMLALFAGQTITPRLLIQGAHMVYGWMPTILELDPADLEAIGRLLTQLRDEEDRMLTGQEWLQIKKAVNNSLVGASKLAHFVAPDRVAIWDSNIVSFLVEGWASLKPAALQSRANRLPALLAYQAAVRDERNTRTAKEIQSQVSKQLEYQVSQLRAMELLMFHSGQKTK